MDVREREDDPLPPPSPSPFPTNFIPGIRESISRSRMTRLHLEQLKPAGWKSSFPSKYSVDPVTILSPQVYNCINSKSWNEKLLSTAIISLERCGHCYLYYLLK